MSNLCREMNKQCRVMTRRRIEMLIFMKNIGKMDYLVQKSYYFLKRGSDKGFAEVGRGLMFIVKENHVAIGKGNVEAEAF
jgi:hypothetical protein